MLGTYMVPEPRPAPRPCARNICREHSFNRRQVGKKQGNLVELLRLAEGEHEQAEALQKSPTADEAVTAGDLSLKYSQRRQNAHKCPLS
jgi:hypothetical protein